MGTPPTSRETCVEAIEALIATRGHKLKAAEALRIPVTTLRNRLNAARRYGMKIPALALDRHPIGYADQKGEEFEVQKLPDPDLPIEELIEHRKRQYAQKQAYEDTRKLVTVNVKIDGPIGIWHFGDPHVDDDGTDLAAIERHSDLVRKTHGVFGANVGDMTNNWIGRLSRLWADQSTSARQSWKLAEWFIRRVKWLYFIGGNHDAWSGEGDPLKWIMEGQTTPYATSEIRLELRFPNKNVCRINARHDFAGHSQYNPAHGPMKATLFGVRDHISVAGHKHTSAHGVLKNPDDGSLMHSFLVASYKFYDRYAREKGLRDQHIAPGVLTIVNCQLPNTHPAFIDHYWDLEYGLDILKYLRSKK